MRLLRREGRRSVEVRRGGLLLLEIRERRCVLLKMRLLLRVRGDGVLVAREILRRRRREGRRAVALRSAIRVRCRGIGHVGEVRRNGSLLLLDGGKVLVLLESEHLLARRRAAVAAVDDLAVGSIRRRRSLLTAELSRSTERAERRLDRGRHRRSWRGRAVILLLNRLRGECRVAVGVVVGLSRRGERVHRRTLEAARGGVGRRVDGVDELLRRRIAPAVRCRRSLTERARRVGVHGLGRSREWPRVAERRRGARWLSSSRRRGGGGRGVARVGRALGRLAGSTGLVLLV